MSVGHVTDATFNLATKLTNTGSRADGAAMLRALASGVDAGEVAIVATDVTQERGPTTMTIHVQRLVRVANSSGGRE